MTSGVAIAWRVRDGTREHGAVPAARSRDDCVPAIRPVEVILDQDLAAQPSRADVLERQPRVDIEMGPYSRGLVPIALCALGGARARRIAECTGPARAHLVAVNRICSPTPTRIALAPS